MKKIKVLSLAATVGRIVSSAVKNLKQKGSCRVLISICADSDMGVAAIINC